MDPLNLALTPAVAQADAVQQTQPLDVPATDGLFEDNEETRDFYEDFRKKITQAVHNDQDEQTAYDSTDAQLPGLEPQPRSLHPPTQVTGDIEFDLWLAEDPSLREFMGISQPYGEQSQLATPARNVDDTQLELTSDGQPFWTSFNADDNEQPKEPQLISNEPGLEQPLVQLQGHKRPQQNSTSAPANILSPRSDNPACSNAAKRRKLKTQYQTGSPSLEKTPLSQKQMEWQPTDHDGTPQVSPRTNQMIDISHSETDPALYPTQQMSSSGAEVSMQLRSEEPPPSDQSNLVYNPNLLINDNSVTTPVFPSIAERSPPNFLSLPKKLRERVAGFLLETKAQRSAPPCSQLDFHQPSSIKTLKNFRLTSKACRDAAWRSLGEAVRNVVFTITPVSLMHLEQIARTPQLRGYVTTLTLSNLVFYRSDNKEFEDVWRKVSGSMNHAAKTYPEEMSPVLNMKISPIMKEAYRRAWDRQNLYRRGGADVTQLMYHIHRLPNLTGLNLLCGSDDGTDGTTGAFDHRVFWSELSDTLPPATREMFEKEHLFLTHLKAILHPAAVSDTSLLFASVSRAFSDMMHKRYITHLAIHTSPHDRNSSLSTFEMTPEVINLTQSLRHFSWHTAGRGALQTTIWPNVFWSVLQCPHNLTVLSLECDVPRGCQRALLSLDNIHHNGEQGQLSAKGKMLPNLRILRIRNARASSATLLDMIHQSLREVLLDGVEIMEKGPSVPFKVPLHQAAHAPELVQKNGPTCPPLQENPLLLDSWDRFLGGLVVRQTNGYTHLQTLTILRPSQRAVLPNGRGAVLNLATLQTLAGSIGQVHILVVRHDAQRALIGGYKVPDECVVYRAVAPGQNGKGVVENEMFIRCERHVWIGGFGVRSEYVDITPEHLR